MKTFSSSNLVWPAGVGKEHLNTIDGHGGMAEEHRHEMRVIANQEIDKRIFDIKDAIRSEAYASFVNNLQFDVETAVSIALDNGKSILLDKRSQEIIAKSIRDEIEKQLQNNIKRNENSI